ncbi:hypothetical protein CspeluHIS016_0307640 [Cutaneotrichosporon spelunceum]|uniref:Mid2 domain-containing protein n=1 Tax=Cutaneotrichosporon spelunceum TaxID=1672016 RepID=A0AAD3TU75_9TREE|nr:hypothetical protein CspeluHIS016_0307640 [Cutaneotrichosporon spelunceum]
MLLSLLLAPLLALPAHAAPAPNPDLMDLWPTRLVPTGTEPTTMVYTFNFPFPTTVTQVWNAPAATATGTGVASGTGTASSAKGTVSGTAMAANAAGGSGGALPFNPLDPNAMTGAIAAAFQTQADLLLKEVKKQTITIVCAILFGTLGGLALLGGLIWCLRRRRRKNKKAKMVTTRAHVRLDSASDIAISEKDRHAAV